MSRVPINDKEYLDKREDWCLQRAKDPYGKELDVRKLELFREAADWGYRLGRLVSTKAPEVQSLVNAAEDWVKYEEEQIEKYGPYVSSQIPAYIARIKECLAAWRK